MADRPKSSDEVAAMCLAAHPTYTIDQIEAYLKGYFDAMLDEHMYNTTKESKQWNS